MYADLMPELSTEIIPPSAQDAEAIATVLYRASAAGYTGIVPPGFLWTLEQTVASCRRLFNDPAATVLAAVSANSPAREWLGVSVVLMPGADPGDAQLRRLYVIPERWAKASAAVSLRGTPAGSARRRNYGLAMGTGEEQPSSQVL